MLATRDRYREISYTSSGISRIRSLGFFPSSSLVCQLKLSQLEKCIAAISNIIEIHDRQQRKLGHALHDGVCQELAGISLLVQAMQRRIEARLPVRRRDVDRISDLVHGALVHTRGLSHLMRAVEPVPDGLMNALSGLAEIVSLNLSAKCRLRCRTNVQVHDPNLANHLYRLSREWVVEAIETGNADEAVISVSRCKHEITLAIRDNGGSNGYREIVSHLMQNRAAMIGAEVKIEPFRGGMRMICRVNDCRNSHETNADTKC